MTRTTIRGRRTATTLTALAVAALAALGTTGTAAAGPVGTLAATPAGTVAAPAGTVAAAAAGVDSVDSSRSATNVAAPPAAPGVPAPMPAASLPATRPVPPKVETERLVPAAPSPGSAGAKQAVSPDPLKLVAVTWTGAAPDLVELRSRLANGTWGDWTRVDPVDAERDGRAVAPTGTEPVWVADTREVQVRATAGGAPATERVALTSIDPGTGGNDVAVATAGATGSPASPKVVTRAQWGADEKKMTWAPEYTPTVRAATIHHTAGTNDYTAAQSAAIVRGIYGYHAVTQGWGDIGYNVLVDRFGTVFEGRAGGLSRAVIAAHAGGFNRETFGIGMMGDFTKVGPTAAALESTSRIAAWKLGGLYRDPRATVTLTSTGGGTSKYPKGRAVTLPVVFAHREVGATECPGNTGYGSMGAIRSRTAALVGSLAANPIRQRWVATPSLGEPSVVETALADGRGRTTAFTGGGIWWTPTTGAWPVRGALLTRWTALGAERSTVGYPKGAEYAVPTGLRQDFERGSLVWNRATNTVTTTNATAR